MASLYPKRIAGKTYWYLREIARVDGKPKMVSERYVGSAAEAAALLDAREQAGPGTYLALAALNRLVAPSARSYESAWLIHVAPKWGQARIADIRYSDVAAWVAELGAQRGRATVVMAYSVLARILDDAVRDRLLAANPARGVKLPKPQLRRTVYLTADQLQRPTSPAATGPWCCC